MQVFYSEQGGFVLDNSVIAEQLASIFTQDGLYILSARPHAPGQLKRLTVRDLGEFDLAGNAGIDLVEDACVNSRELFVAGLDVDVPTVVSIDPSGEMEDSWTVGQAGNEIGWGVASEKWVGYLVGENFVVKGPKDTDFGSRHVPSASKVFWADLQDDPDGRFVLECNDRWVRFVHPLTGATQDVTMLGENETLLRVDPASEAGRVDMIITESPVSYWVFHV